MNNIKAFIYKDMKRNATFKVLLMFIVGLFLSVNTFAQQIVVKGIVKDTTGEPIIGANVIVKGTTNGTITDFDGNFLVSIRPRACFFPLFSFLPLWLHYNLNPLCVQY